jgi:hypothetical protein
MEESGVLVGHGRTPSASGREADAAELHEQIELLEAHIRSLRAERELRATELLVARSWVKELALWLDEAQQRTGGTALPATTPQDQEAFLSPRTIRLLHEAEHGPIRWGNLAIVAALVVVPWAVLGAVAYLVHVIAG